MTDHQEGKEGLLNDVATTVAKKAANEALSDRKKEAGRLRQWITDGPMTLNVFCFLSTVFSSTTMILTSFGVLLSFDPMRMVNGIYALAFCTLMCCVEVRMQRWHGCGV